MESNKEWETETLSGVRQGVPGARSRHDGLRETWQVAEEAGTFPTTTNSTIWTSGCGEPGRGDEQYTSLSLTRRNTRRKDRSERIKRSLEMNIEVTRTYYCVNRCKSNTQPRRRHSFPVEFT